MLDSTNDYRYIDRCCGEVVVCEEAFRDFDSLIVWSTTMGAKAPPLSKFNVKLHEPTLVQPIKPTETHLLLLMSLALCKCGNPDCLPL